MSELAVQPSHSTENKLVRVYWVIAGILGALVATLGLLTGVALVVFMAAEQAIAGLFAAAMLAVIMGVAVMWGAIRGLRKRPGRSLFSKFGWLFWLMLTGGLLGGGLLLPDGAFAHWAFGFLHVAVTISASLFVINLVARFTGRENAMNWRQAITGMAGGASGVLIAFPVELIGLLVSATALVLIAQLIPGGRAEVDRVMAILGDIPTMMTMESTPVMESSLTALLTSPLVIGTMLLGISVITPFIEEFGKVMVMLFVWKADQPLTSKLDARGRLARAFIWGAVCGLGFAIVEGVFSGASALTAQTAWTQDVLVRLLATNMHVFVSGLVGLGWGMSREYKWWWLPVFYLGAVTLHGIWNANALLMVWAAAIETGAAVTAQIVSISGIVVQVLLSLLAFSAVIAIPVVLNSKSSKSVTL